MIDIPLDEILAQLWKNKKKFGELYGTQCPTVFKVTGHRCEGIYGHARYCEDIDYPAKPSKDLELTK